MSIPPFLPVVECLDQNDRDSGTGLRTTGCGSPPPTTHDPVVASAFALPLTRAEYRRQCKAGALFGDWQPPGPRYKPAEEQERAGLEIGDPQPAYEIDKRELESFLNRLASLDHQGGVKGLHLQCFDEAKSERAPKRFFNSVAEAVAWAKVRAAEGWWIGLKPNVAGKDGSKNGKLVLRAAVLDLDKDGPAKLQKALTELRDLGMQPIVSETSPGKYHVIFLLHFAKHDASPDAVDRLQKELIRRFGGDGALCHWAFTFRLPGTKNTKPDLAEPYPVRILPEHRIGGVTYDELIRAFVEKPQAEPEIDDATATERQRKLAEFVRRQCEKKGTGKSNHTLPFGEIMKSLRLAGAEEDDLLYAAEVFKELNPEYRDNTDRQIRDIVRKYEPNEGADIDAWLARRAGDKAEKAAPTSADDLLRMCNEALLSGEAILTTKATPREQVLGELMLTSSVALLYAARGVGKTWCGLGIAHAIATGGTWGNWKAPNRRRVLYVDGEMAYDLMQERIKALFGGDPPGEFMLLSSNRLYDSSKERINIVEPRWQETIKRLAAEHRADVVILDNLSALSPGVDENDNTAQTTVKELLEELRFEGRCVVLIHHAGKSGDQRGASRREDSVDVTIKLVRPPESKEPGFHAVLSLTKARHMRDASAKLDMTLVEKDGRTEFACQKVGHRKQDAVLDRLVQAFPRGIALADLAKALDEKDGGSNIRKRCLMPMQDEGLVEQHASSKEWRATKKGQAAWRAVSDDAPF